MAKKSESKKEIKIKESWCKGCEICVEFCPHNVLVMKDGKAFVENLETCTACGLCELYCPDFAIEVFVINDNDKVKIKKWSEYEKEI